MALSWHPKAGKFSLKASNENLRARAERAGLSVSARGSLELGCPTYVMGSHYEALPFLDVATPQAATELDALRVLEEHSRVRWPTTDPLPTPPDRDPMPFQRAGLEYILDRAHTIIGDEMGLGKTIEAICAASYWQCKKVLIVCPANLRLNWEKEIRAWTMLRGVNIHVIMKAKNGVSPYAHFVVVSYDLARNKALNEALRHEDWDLVILDECHYMKNVNALRTRVVLGSWAAEGEDGYHPGLIRKSPHVLALTGTLLPNRPKECYTITRALCWEALDWMSYNKFMLRYAPEKRLCNGHLLERTRHLGELQMRLRCHLMLRRLAKNVLEDFPEKIYELSYIEPNGAIRKALHAESLLDIDVNNLDMKTIMEGHISTVRRLMGEAKVPRVIEHMKTLLDGGLEKVILFAHHRSVMDELDAALNQYGLVRFDRRTPVKKRDDLVVSFQTDPKIRIFLGQDDTASEGITLTAASRVVLVEPSWSSKNNEQCIGRALRIGQNDTVLAQFLVAPGSLDERIIGKAISKADDIHETLDAKEE